MPLELKLATKSPELFKFEIEVCRMSAGFNTITVEAENEFEAGQMALDEAGNHIYKEKDCDYVLTNPVPNPEDEPDSDDLSKKDVLKIDIKTVGYMHATSSDCISSDPTAYSNPRELVLLSDVHLLFDRIKGEMASVAKLSTRTNNNVTPDKNGMLKTSVGHEIDASTVQEWVGLHYKHHYHDMPDTQKQQLIDRYAMVNEEAYPTYLTCEAWGHIFTGKHESTTRWVYKFGMAEDLMVAGQVLIRGTWSDMSKEELADVQEDIEDNDVPDQYARDFPDEVQMTTELPEWAIPVPKGPKETDVDRPRG